MTVLSACQQASRLMTLEAPLSIFGSTDTYAIELSALVNESAQAIAKAHDWRKLTVLQTQTGNNAATAFDLPTDYDRMPMHADVYTTRSRTPLSRVPDLNYWLEIELQNLSGGIGWWFILGGQIHFKPVLSSTDAAKYYYISNKIATANDASTKATFSADDDTFRLPERLLTLDLIWRWRQMKGLDYAEAMRNFEIAFGEEAGREKGSRIIRVGQARMPNDVNYAYPGYINA